MKHSFRLLAVAVAALGLAACQGASTASQGKDAAPRELKLYNVPPQRSPALLQALRETIINGKGDTVTQPFPGKLLVAAPADEQASIGAAIRALSKAADTAARPEKLHVHFWVVDAFPGAGPDATVLQPLSDTLDALRKQIGPSHFLLDDTAMAMVMPGQAANLLDTAKLHNFEFWIPSTSTGHVQLALRYDDRSGKGFRSLKTVTSMELGHYVVLAQASAPDANAHADAAGPHATMRLLVVRVDHADGDH